MALAMIDIVNAALRLMGDTELNSLEDGSAQSARIKGAWKGSVEYLLSLHPWAFALRRVALARAAVDIPGYAHAYTIPADTMRVVAVLAGEGTSPLPVGTWTLEAGHILCHAPSALCLHVFRNMDVSTWSPGFCATAAAFLAFETARALTRTEMAPQLEQLYRQRLDSAQLHDTPHQTEAPAHLVPTPVMAARLGHDDCFGIRTAALGYPLTLEGIR